MHLYLQNLNTLHPSFVSDLGEIALVVLEKIFFKFCQCIFLVSRYYLPFGKRHGPSFE